MTKSPEYLKESELEEIFDAAMRQVGSFGVIYPEGYNRELIRKYSREGLRHPYIVRDLGHPRIKNHFIYQQVLRRSGRFLDYGCGTGDNVRQLIRDGYKKGDIAAFDINGSDINLGFYLYRDREEMGDIFSVSEVFPFGPGEFEIIYSGFVLHVIADNDELAQYLSNAYNALRPGGILFGSTLGLKDRWTLSTHTCFLRRMMRRQDISRSLTNAGFIRPEIICRYFSLGLPRLFDRMCVLEFSARKPYETVP